MFSTKKSQRKSRISFGFILFGSWVCTKNHGNRSCNHIKSQMCTLTAVITPSLSSAHYSIALFHTHRRKHTCQTYNTPPLCLFICMIISSCPKEQQQDIWCNTIAGPVPRGALFVPSCKTTGASSLALSLQPGNGALSANTCLKASWEYCIIGCSCVQTTGFIPTLSTFFTGEPLSQSRFYTAEEWALSWDPLGPSWAVWSMWAVSMEWFALV